MTEEEAYRPVEHRQIECVCPAHGACPVTVGLAARARPSLTSAEGLAAVSELNEHRARDSATRPTPKCVVPPLHHEMAMSGHHLFGNVLFGNVALASCGLIMAFTTACSRQPAAPPVSLAATTPAPQVPTADRSIMALRQIGDGAKWLFDAAYASDWSAVADYEANIREAQGELPSNLPLPDVVAQLRSRLDQLRRDTRGRQRLATMGDANAITKIVAGLSSQFQTLVPYEADLLGFYGRELELGILSGDSSTLAQATTDLQSTWNALEQRVEDRGGVDLAKRFTDAVVQLVGARRPSDYVAPTRAELVESARVVQLFQTVSW
jgi:hypothetical protein